MFDRWFKKQPPKPADGPDPIGAATQRLQQNPRDVLALMDRAEAYLASRNAEFALRDVDRCLQLVLPETGLKPETRVHVLARLYSMRSRALAGSGDLNGALQAITRALEAKPDDPELLCEAARLQIDQGQFPQALSLLDTALQRAPNHAGALALRGQVRGRQGNLVGSVVDLERSLQMDPTNLETRFNCALAYLHSYNPTAAWLILDTLLAQAPGDTQARALYDHVRRDLIGPADETLLPITGVLERFAFFHCGPRRTQAPQEEIVWRVGTLPVTTFSPGGSVQSVQAAGLDLCQTPGAQILVKVVPGHYVIVFQEEFSPPEIKAMKLEGGAWTTAFEDTVPAHPDTLLGQLHSYVQRGILVKERNRLRFKNPKSQ